MIIIVIITTIIIITTITIMHSVTARIGRVRMGTMSLYEIGDVI